MSDNYNISYSYQQGSTAPTPGADEPLVAFANCDTVKMDGNSVLLLHRDNGRQLAVAPEVATALGYCDTFQTLQEHADNLAATIPQLKGQANDVINVLRMVDDAGFMLRAETVAERLRQTDQTEASLVPTRVFIITSDRPAAVERLLDSLLQFGQPGRQDELFLVDDSRREDSRSQNRELVATFNRSSPKAMGYVGVAQQQQLLDRMIAIEPQLDKDIRYLLDRERWSAQKSYGLARNLCLLLSVGYRCIVLDDDVLCRAVLPPAQGDSVNFAGGSNRELACFGSEQDLMAQARFADTDPLSGHARCLGMNLGQSLIELGESELSQSALRGCNAAMLNTLRGNSPVLLTQCGSWGDPGAPGSSWFTHLGQDSVERILSAPGGLSASMRNRYYWLGRNHPNVGKMAIMSQVTGLDNSYLLPPYFPVYRGEDYLFAAMLVYLYPLSAVLDYNWSVPHLPLEARPGGTPESPAVSHGGLGLAARYLVDRIDYEEGVTAETRLDSLAVMLGELGERKVADLLASFRLQLAQERADELSQIQSQLQSAGAFADEEWETFLQHRLRGVSTALQSPANPADMPEVADDLDETAVMEILRDGIGAFGRALAAWPAIRAAASTATTDMLASDTFAP